MQTAKIQFPGTGKFSLGSAYDSEAVAQRACDAANKVIKTKSATEMKSDVESMIEVCRDAAHEETGIPSAKSYKVVGHAKVVITTEDGRKLGGFTSCPKASEACGEDKQAVQATLTSKTGRVRKTNFFARRGTPMDSVGLSDLGKQLLYCDENGAPTKKKKTSQVTPVKKKNAPAKKKAAPVKKKAAPVKMHICTVEGCGNKLYRGKDVCRKHYEAQR